jgi:hypothetical protein
MSMQTIFFDESGFTGQDLSQASQPWFTYVGVPIEPEAADALVNAFRSSHHIQSDELAFNMQRPKSRQQAIALLHQLPSISRVAIFNKQMALACKFYEYVFEPVVKDFNSFYYEIDFHRYISQMIYLFNMHKEELSSRMLLEFERLMRKRQIGPAVALFGVIESTAEDNPITWVRRFSSIHADKIRQEVEARTRDGVKQWTLDLTISALSSLLSGFAESFESMQAICDDSKPLLDTAGFLDAQIGKTEKIYVKLGTIQGRLTYNLAGPVQMRSSKVTPGLQLADTLARSANWAIMNPDEPDSGVIRQWLTGRISPCSITANLDEVDTKNDSYWLNSVVLHELMSRSQRGVNLIDGMSELVEQTRRHIPRIKKAAG